MKVHISQMGTKTPGASSWPVVTGQLFFDNDNNNSSDSDNNENNDIIINLQLLRQLPACRGGWNLPRW